MCAQEGTIPNAAGVSDLFWQWGQFLDHDIDLTPQADPAEPFFVDVPVGDPWFDPDGAGTAVMPLTRSAYEYVEGVREQVNGITAFIDGLQVYGSAVERARALRTLDGTGRLKESAGHLLPFNEPGLDNAPSSDASYFLAGDIRANEQAALTTLHTLFVREHNYWAKKIARVATMRRGARRSQPRRHRTRRRLRREDLGMTERGARSGDEIYALARMIVGAGISEDHLPGALVGPTFHAILMDQFEALRDGDRFFYTRRLPEHCVRLVEERTLARIIRRNALIGREVRDDPWHAR